MADLRRRRWQTFRVFFAILPLFLSACRTAAPVATEPLRPWVAAERIATPYAVVEAEQAGTATRAAADVVQQMGDALAAAWPQARFGVVTVRLYVAPGQYAALVRERHYPPANVAMADLDRGELVVGPALSGQALREHVAHELSHALLQAYGDQLAGVTAPQHRPLPWWLQEGLATYCEVAFTRPPGATGPPVNRARARELQWRLRGGELPTIANVLAIPPTATGRSPAYAVAWGLTYDLLHPAGAPAPDWARWHAALTAALAGAVSPEDQLALPATTAWPAWERAWQRRMLRL